MQYLNRIVCVEEKHISISKPFLVFQSELKGKKGVELASVLWHWMDWRAIETKTNKLGEAKNSDQLRNQSYKDSFTC